MQTNLRKDHSYKNKMVNLSLLTVLSVFGCMLAGYICLPFAASFYALLILNERSEKRVLTYILPVLLYIVNFVFNGLYSLEALTYIAIGAVIFLCYKKQISKSETAFWSMLILLVSMMISAVFLAFNEMGAVNLTSIKQFYLSLFNSAKNGFVDYLTNIVMAADEGFLYFLYNKYQVLDIFRSFVYLIIPLTVIFDFILVGVSLKIFSSGVIRYSADEKTVSEWRFSMSNISAYFYIFISLIAIFVSGGDGIFELTVTSVYTILLFIFAYIGIHFIYKLITSYKSGFFAVTVLALALLIFYAFAFQLFSYIGVYYTVVTNNYRKKNHSKN